MTKYVNLYIISTTLKGGFVKTLKLDTERIVHLFGSITNAALGEVSSKILELYKKDTKKPIFLFLHVHGGISSLAYGFYDLIKTFRIPLVTVAVGKIASSGVVLFLSGGERFIGDHTIISLQNSKADYNDNLMELNIEERVIFKKFLQQIFKTETMVKNIDGFEELLKKEIINPDECIDLLIATKYLNSLA